MGNCFCFKKKQKDDKYDPILEYGYPYPCQIYFDEEDPFLVPPTEKKEERNRKRRIEYDYI